MAITTYSSLGTFMGRPVQHWNGVNKPQTGDLVHDMATMSFKVFDGKDWYEIEHPDPEVFSELQNQIRNARDLSDDYLEETYPDLKALREQYNELRDKYRTFEALKQDGTEI